MQKVIAVNFRRGGKVYYFLQGDFDINPRDIVIVDTAKSQELAYVVKINIEVDENDYPDLKGIVRIATDKDIERHNNLYKDYDTTLKQVKDIVAKYELDMKVCDIEFPFEGGKIVINFTSDNRVDFRELVKELASTLHSRIELRQIGVRDQAKNIGALGVCGKECCCKEYLSDFDKVSIKMAKNQNLSLNPTKISGMCGRLMCCLAYENDFYAEQNKLMPKINSRVSTPSGVGQVIYNDILKGEVSVRFEKDDMVKIEQFSFKDVKQLEKEKNEKK